MEDKKYNGWTNYETWVTKLWMDNDSGSYAYWKKQAEEAYAAASPINDWEDKKRAAVRVLASIIKEHHDELEYEILDAAKSVVGGSSVFHDLLNAALSEVNWYEIAEHLIEDHCGEAPVQEKTSE